MTSLVALVRRRQLVLRFHMTSTLVQPPSPAPISFALNHPRNVKLWTSPLVAPRPTQLAATATTSTAPTDIDRLLSTAPTAIPRPIAFVEPQKEANARPQHSTPLSAATTPASPATQPATPTSTPATPNGSAAPVAVKHSHTNGIHNPLASKLAQFSPQLVAVSTTGSSKLSSLTSPADDNTFHPALHQLFPTVQLPALSRWPASVTGPGTGLANLGNSCFMNATLQALTHTPMLANYCLSRRHSLHCPIKHQKSLPPLPPPPPPPTAAFGFGTWRPSLQSFQSSQQQRQPMPPFCLFCALEENVVRSFKQSAAFAPSAIFNRLPSLSRSLRPGRQEDAHEFLRLALDMLQSNVLAADLPSRPSASSSSSSPASIPSKAPLQLPKGSSVPAALFALLTPAQLHRVKETSVLYQIFSGYYRSTLTCRSCHQPSHTFEPFLDLSLSIPTSSASSSTVSSGYQRLPSFGFNRPFQPAFANNQPPQPPLTLHQCLRAFTSEEQLDNDNMYKCTSCKKKSRAAKRLTIHAAPNVLVVHLKRFEHSGLGMGGGGGKIGRMVRFDTVLDIGEYMSERGGGSGVEAKVEYELYAVLVHAGSTLYSGHYYSFVKAADGRWYEMNDSSVQRRTVEEVLAQKAYILFYTKKVIDTAAKGAGSTAAAGKTGKEGEREVEKKKEKVAAPLAAANGAVKDKSADEMIKALMRGSVSAGHATPHLNGHASVKVAEEEKEQSSDRVVEEERKEERMKTAEEERKVHPTVVPATKPAERADERGSVGAVVDKRAEQKDVKEEREEKRVDSSRISLATATIHQTTVSVSFLAPPASASASVASSTAPVLVRPPSSPLSPPSAASSPSSTGSGSTKRKQMNGWSPPSVCWYPGMPSFRTGSQAKFTAFAMAPNGGVLKKVKRELMGNGVGVGIRLVPYSSSSDDDEQQEEKRAQHTGPPHSSGGSEEESKAQSTEKVERHTPKLEEEKTQPVAPVVPSIAASSAPANEQQSEPRQAENDDRKRRRLDVEAATQPTAAPTSNATRFDPHAGRHTARSHYGADVGTWEEGEGGSGTEKERRERDEVLRRLERERSGRTKDEYDVMYDEGKKRKVRGEKDDMRGVAVKAGENLLQREQERREGRGDRDDERDRRDHRRNSDSRSSHHDSNGYRRHSGHHSHNDDRGRSRHQPYNRDRRHSSTSRDSHSSHRDSRDSHHSSRSHRGDDRDRSRHSWSDRR